ncbi:AgrD family cyclic lactone autoinducer peptide [Paenibacillus sp. OV219]|uniref:AgrD family cyclic lactone autoinducer peptide n=1 Tax=Paenibacillus sp. OV219 TaxID=1884377 RepID=UPI0008CFC1C4|nr:cyclic lactone autoinducer peptide [Paenibacillus sp. OV219]SEM66092.1 cyclic lactone autoinducer peptide [Paenibacillus sp. OV219]
MLKNILKKISAKEMVLVTAATYAVATVLHAIADEVAPASWLFVHQEETPDELL